MAKALKTIKKYKYSSEPNKKYIRDSTGFCCENCGGLIKGKAYNINGKITHIGQCSNQSKKKIR